MQFKPTSLLPLALRALCIALLLCGAAVIQFKSQAAEPPPERRDMQAQVAETQQMPVQLSTPSPDAQQAPAQSITPSPVAQQVPAQAAGASTQSPKPEALAQAASATAQASKAGASAQDAGAKAPTHTAGTPAQASEKPAQAAAPNESDLPQLTPEQLEAIWKKAESFVPAAAPPEGTSLNITIDESLINWKALDEGLELLELGLSKSNGGAISLSSPFAPAADLIILRVNPEHYEFTLHMASEDGQQRSLAENAALYGLTAAINAGMYLPDNLTNTGYMQSSTHINNPRIVSRFGVFFVAEPHMDSLPKAILLEKRGLGSDPAKFLNHYTIVVQNFRLISAEGEILWPQSQSVHSISALAQDKNGNILLMLCRFQLSPADFASLIMALPLHCSAAMYLEGGSHAGLLLKSFNGNGPSVWRGKRNSILALDGPSDSPLPNVLGIRPRPKESAPHAE